MEFISEMGQVGYVTHKMSELEVSGKIDKRSVEDTQVVIDEKNADICNEEPTDGLETHTCYQEEIQKEENFIYSGFGNKQVPIVNLKRIDELTLDENGYEISTSWIPRKCENGYKNTLSMFQTDCEKDQEVVVKVVDSVGEKDLGTNSTDSRSSDNFETDGANRYELPMHLSSDKYDVTIEETLESTPSENGSEKGNILHLISSESDEKVYESLAEDRNKSSLIFTPPEHENLHDLAMIWTPSDCMNGKEANKNLLSSECDDEYNISSSSLIYSKCGSKQEAESKVSSEFCKDNGLTSNFVGNECQCEQGSSNDLHHSETKTLQETSENVVLPACENDIKSVLNSASPECEIGQQADNNLISTDCENRHKPGKNSMYCKYIKGNEILKNVPKNTRKEALHCAEMKVGRIYSGPSYSLRDDSFVIPSDALADKIVRQAEFYFSDFNVFKNNFLLKHIRKNREGYISLKLVASFRKIKSLTKDCRVVAYSVEGSNLLELNAERNKVRRLKKIPKLRDTSFGRTVVAFHLPFKTPTQEELKELFSKFGNVLYAEVMTPKSPNYNIYHKRCRFNNQEVSSSLFGAVEFEKYEDAIAAIKDEEGHLPKENKMKVVPLMVQKYRSSAENSGSSSTSFAPVLRRGKERFNPKFEMQKGRQVDDANAGENEANIRPPIGEKFYKGNYRPRYAWKPQTYGDVRGKVPAEKFVDKVDEVDKNGLLKRQLKASNSLNVKSVPFHQQQRGPGRAYLGPVFQRSMDA